MRFRARLGSDRTEEDSKGAAGLFRELGVPFYLAVTELEQAEWLIGQRRSEEAEPWANLALSLHFYGTQRNGRTQAKRLITRRSQVQILPPLLRRGPGNGAFSLRGQRIGAVAAGWQAGLILRPGKRTPRRRPTADLHRQRTWTRLPTS